MTVNCKVIPKTGDRFRIYRASWLPMPEKGELIDLMFEGTKIGEGEVISIDLETRDILVEVVK